MEMQAVYYSSSVTTAMSGVSDVIDVSSVVEAPMLPRKVLVHEMRRQGGIEVSKPSWHVTR